MKKVISMLIGVVIGFALPANAENTIEQRLAELESKVTALETAVTERLKNCVMTYQFHAYRLNTCDKGAFAKSVTDVGGGSLQLECGYYQLKCEH